jgi:hypothetical protein
MSICHGRFTTFQTYLYIYGRPRFSPKEFPIEIQVFPDLDAAEEWISE